MVLLNDCKTKHPGTKYCVLHSFDKLIEPLRTCFFHHPAIRIISLILIPMPVNTAISTRVITA